MKLKSLILVMFASLLSSVAVAGQINVSKLRLNLENGKTADFLTMHNDSLEEKGSYEISIQKWSQEVNPDFANNKALPALRDVLVSTENILVSPKTAVLLPNQDKIIRVMINDNEKALKDYSYRLIINQLPDSEVNVKNNGIKLLFKISLPVFVYPTLMDNIDKMNIATNLYQENGKQYLSIKNNEKQHIQIQSVRSGDKIASVNHYVLPGSMDIFELPKEVKNIPTNTKLELVTDKGPLVVTK